MHQRKLRLESLENRHLLAGTVTATVVNGSLIIQGDDLDNQISVAATETAGEFIIRGRSEANFGAITTTINGSASEEGIRVTGVRGSVHINMGDGNDSVSTSGFDQIQLPSTGTYPRPTTRPRTSIIYTPGLRSPAIVLSSASSSDVIRSASSSDYIGSHRFFEFRVRRDLVIDMGDGDDTVNVEGRISRRVEIRSGDGNDAITADRIHARDLVIDTGNGNDEVQIGGASDTTYATGVWPNRPSRFANIRRDLRVDTGAGDDVLDQRISQVGQNEMVTMGDGDDRMLMNLPQISHHQEQVNISRNCVVDLGEGNDHFQIGNGVPVADYITRSWLANVAVGRRMIVTAGAGDDTIDVTDLKADRFQVDTGPGNDEVTVRELQVDEFFANLGDGDDQLTAEGSQVASETRLDGGPGVDRFQPHGENEFGRMKKKNFELNDAGAVVACY